jgi:hypothetical protein
MHYNKIGNDFRKKEFNNLDDEQVKVEESLLKFRCG